MVICASLCVRAAIGPLAQVPLFRFDVLQPEPTPGMQTVARLLDSAQKSRIVFELIFKPVFLRFETDQHSGWLAVTRDDDLLGLRKDTGTDRP